MRNLRTFGVACVLALMLAAPAFAGHIETPAAQPQPTPATATEPDTSDVAGHIETPLASTDAVTEVALNLIGGVLALL